MIIDSNKLQPLYVPESMLELIDQIFVKLHTKG